MLFSPLLSVGEAAPSFHLLDQNGLIVSLENGTLEHAQGPQGTVLLFFSSHFLPQDLQMLNRFAQAYPLFREQGLEVLAISGLNWETLHHLAGKLELPYRVLFDPCCRISSRYQVMMMPKFVTGRAVYGIDARGVIRYSDKKSNPQVLLEHLRTSDGSSVI
jgi:peroxiredoxin